VGRLASRIWELLHSRKRSACSIKHSHTQQASGEMPSRLQGGSSRRMVLKRLFFAGRRNALLTAGKQKQNDG